MAVLTTDLIQQKKAKKSEIIDIILFVVISVAVCGFSLGCFGFDLDANNNYQKTFVYRMRGYLNWPLLLVVFVAYVTMIGILAYRRYKKTKVKPSNGVWALFIIVSLLYAIMPATSAYGAQVYSYTCPFDQNIYQVNYTFEIFDRILTWFCNSMFFSYFPFAITYFKTFDKVYMRKAVHFGFYFLIGLGIAMNLYSHIFEFQGWLTMDKNLMSFAGHKNYYGFYELLAIICAAIYFFQKPNWFVALCLPYFLANMVIIPSRTPLLLAAIIFLFTLIVFPIINRKKYKQFNRYCLILLGVIIIAGVALGILYKDKLLSVLEQFNDMSTMTYRSDHWKMAFSMLNDPYHIILGYGRVPFVNIYLDYQTQIVTLKEGLDILEFAHNAFLETWMYSGIVGLLIVAMEYGYMGYMTVYLLRKKRYFTLIYIVIFLCFLLYGIVEPRMLFSFDAGNIFFVVVLFWPLILDYCNCRKETEDPRSILLYQLD